MIACAFATGQFFIVHDVGGLVQPPKVYWLTLIMAVVAVLMPPRLAKRCSALRLPA